LGLLVSAIVDNATKDRRDSGAYRIPLSVQIGWSLILISGMLFLPETPRYLIKRNRPDAASRSLAKLRRLPRNSPHLAEIAEIAQYHERELNLGGTSYLDCFKGNLGKRLLTGCLLQSLQQLSGINFIFYYSTSFFENNGMYDAYTITLITNIVNVVSTVPGLWMVEKWGRRPLLFFGAIGMAVSQIIVATIGTAAAGHSAADKASLAFNCIYIFFFACSWGPVVWVVPGEIFSLKVRAKAMSISTAANWLFNWAMSYAIPYMIDPGQGNLNLQAKVFYVWGGFCVIACLVAYFLVYETKGLSLEQVDEMYSSIGKAWESHYFVPEAHPPRPRPWSGNRYSGQKPASATYKCHIEAVNSPKKNDDDDDDYETKENGKTMSPQSEAGGGTFYFDFDRPVGTQQFS
jgi:SP family sugar:H+ symporter-like MFS transporter